MSKRPNSLSRYFKMSNVTFLEISNQLFERSKPLRDLELRLKPVLSPCPVWQVRTTGFDSSLAKTKLDLGLILRTGFGTETRFSIFFQVTELNWSFHNSSFGSR
jgi:hypothetical protein